MNIIVCVKQILDPELPLSKFKINRESNTVARPEGIPPVISPFDEEAVELAVRVKEAHGGKITAVSASDNEDFDVLRHAIAMGADEGVLIKSDGASDVDGFGTAYLLSQAIRKIGEYDLILCGREASDWDRGVTGSLIAMNLGIDVIPAVRSVAVDGDGIRAERETENGFEIWQAATPVLVTAYGLDEKPRLPTGMGIIMAARKPITVWTGDDLDLDSAVCDRFNDRIRLTSLDIADYERQCRLFDDVDVKEGSVKLAKEIKRLIA